MQAMPREGKEGLVERSRRMLSGRRATSREDNPGPQQEAVAGEKSDSNADLAAYHRRRDQVRRAQRSHRERKENYIKGLEQEIAELRENDSAAVRELEAQVAYLKSLIDIHGIILPEQWKLEATSGAGYGSSQRFAMASFAQEGTPSGYIQISKPESSYATALMGEPGDVAFGESLGQQPLDTRMQFPYRDEDFGADAPGPSQMSSGEGPLYQEPYHWQ